MIVACHRCKAKVDASVIASREHYDPEEMPEPSRISLLKCPVCNSTLVAEQFQIYIPEEGEVWCGATRQMRRS